MKRNANWGGLLLITVLALPTVARAQDEGTAYANFYAESDCKTKAPMGEKFMADFKTSQYVDGVFRQTENCYFKLNNFPKVMEMAGKVDQVVPSMESANKAQMYAYAMQAAQQSQNVPQTIAFGEKVIAIAPDDLNTLLLLSNTIAYSMQTDKAATDKAIGYAEKGLKSIAGMDAKSVGMSADDWVKQKTAIEGQLHNTLGTLYFNAKDYDKAVDELTAATKSMPKDGTSWYLLGLAYNQQYTDQVKPYQEAVTKSNAAIKAKEDQAIIEEGKATVQALEAAVREKRDQAIDALATAVALGGTTKEPAMAQLTKLYSNKNNGSTAGLDQLINSKKPAQ